MSRSMPPAALPLLAAVLVLAALPPIGVDLAPNASAGHATWVKTTTLPSERRFTAAATDGAVIYLFGGGLPSGAVDPRSDEVLRYDPSTDTLAVMGARLPSGVDGASAVWDTLEEVAYVFGGNWDSLCPSPCQSDRILRYDPATDTLTTLPEVLPSPRATMSAVWDPRHRPVEGCGGGCAYLFGGGRSGVGQLSEIVKYNPATGTVAVAHNGLPARDRTSAAWDSSANVAYLFGGVVSGLGPTAEVMRYDPVTNALTSLLNILPVPTHSTSAVWAGGFGYVFGGFSSAGNAIVRFDPATGTTTTLAARLPSARSDTSAVWDGTNAYVFGGLGLVSNAALDSIVRFPPVAHPPVAVISAIPASECDAGRGTAQLGGTGSFDPDGTPVTHLWSSPGDVTFNNAALARPVASAPFGTTPVKLRASSGGLTDASTASIRVVDTLPPFTSATPDGVPGNEDWWRSPVVVELTAVDRCGVASTSFSIDQGAFVEGNSAHVEGDGEHAVQYRTTDIGGNVETTRAIGLRIDATPPAVAILQPEEGQAYVSMKPVGDACRLVLGEAQCDALESTMYPLDPGPTAGLVLDALNTFLERCEETLSPQICDQVPDELPEVPAPVELNATLVVGEMIVRADATDDVSGVARVEFAVDGVVRWIDEVPPYEFTWNAGDEAFGTHVLAARAFDVAGNEWIHELEVTTAPTTPVGVSRTAQFSVVCGLVFAPAQCDAFKETIDTLDPDPTLAVLRDAINGFLETCEETLSPVICQFLPEQLPGAPGASAPVPPDGGEHGEARAPPASLRERGGPE